MKKILLGILMSCSLCASAQTTTAKQLNGSFNTILETLSFIESRLSALEQSNAKIKEAVNTVSVHEYVDLGLPSGTKWATCNLGADSPEDYGLYYAWGETTGYSSSDGHEFSFSNYKYIKSGGVIWTDVTKYTHADGKTNAVYYSNGTYVGSTVDGVTYLEKTKLDLEDDAATINWGIEWRMPTETQLTELETKCTWTWTTQSGVNGYKVTGTNGNSIFLPAAGYIKGTTYSGAGTEGYYWTNTLATNFSARGRYLYFTPSKKETTDQDRCYGRSVRPVRN